MEVLQPQKDVSEKLYSPLKSWQIRLVRLHPDVFDARICLDLFPVDLIYDEGVLTADLEVVNYEALSYCWGQFDLSDLCLCNGLEYPITSNLGEALRFLRHSTSERLLWVDAICINQHDDTEKSIQVMKMPGIYSKAQSVTAWIGNSTQGLHQYLSEWKENITSSVWTYTPKTELSPKEHQLSHVYLFSCPWLQRTWVRQEVYEAKSLKVQCGILVMPWEKYRDISNIDMLTNVDKDHRIKRSYKPKRILQKMKLDANQRTKEYVLGLKNIQALNNGYTRERYFHRPYRKVGGRYRWEAGRESVLLDSTGYLRLLSDGVGFQATDPRDLIFSLHGMAGGHNKAVGKDGFPVNYSLTYRQVCSAFTKYIIMQNNNLDILQLCALQSDTTHAIDWRAVRWSRLEIVEKSNDKICEWLGFVNTKSGGDIIAPREIRFPLPTQSEFRSMPRWSDIFYLDQRVEAQLTDLRDDDSDILLLFGTHYGVLHEHRLATGASSKGNTAMYEIRRPGEGSQDAPYSLIVDVLQLFDGTWGCDVNDEDTKTRNKLGFDDSNFQTLLNDVKTEGVESAKLSLHEGMKDGWSYCWILPLAAKTGDHVVILQPGAQCYVLRPIEQGGKERYTVVGPAFCPNWNTEELSCTRFVGHHDSTEADHSGDYRVYSIL